MHKHLPVIGQLQDLQGPPVVADVPSRLELAEEQAWAHLYRAVRQPAAATEVVNYCTAHPDALRRLEPMYLIACETLHARALVDEQNERTIAFFRAVFVTAPRRAWLLAKAVVLGAGRPAAEPAAAPPPGPRSSRLSPAKARVGALAKHPEVAQAINGIDTSASAVPSAPKEAAGNRGN